jgi:AcrR family transcriptional regulator
MATSPKSEARANELLDAAAVLFNAKGYHATTIDDIGSALGMTGPALYRYYKGKPQMLTTLFEGTLEFLLEHSGVVESEARSGTEALHGLVHFHVDYVLSNRARMHIIRAEVNALPEDARARFRASQQAYLQSWANTLRRARQDLSNREALTIVAGVVALANQYARRANELEDDALRGLVMSMCIAALHAPVPATEHEADLVLADTAAEARAAVEPT